MQCPPIPTKDGTTLVYSATTREDRMAGRPWATALRPAPAVTGTVVLAGLAALVDAAAADVSAASTVVGLKVKPVEATTVPLPLPLPTPALLTTVG